MKRALTFLSVALATVLLSPPGTAQFDPEQWTGDPFERLEQLPIAEPVADAQRVIVQLRATREYVPADVYVFSKSAVPAATWSHLRQNYLAPELLVAARHATHYRADEDGYALVAMPDDGVCIAIAGEHVGIHEHNCTDTWISLDEWIRVRAEVLDHEGRPAAGVPVVVNADTPSRRAVIGETDRTGRLSTRIEKPRPGVKLDLRADVAGAEGIEPVPERDTGAKPRLVQLRLPPTGSLQVVLPDALAARPFCVNAALFSSNGLSRARKWTERGPLFSLVAIERDVESTVHVGHLNIKLTVTGPQAAGEHVEVTPDFDEFAVLPGRLVDASGQPHAAAPLWTVFPSVGRMTSLDDNGVFHLVARRTEVVAEGGHIALFCLDAKDHDEIGRGDATIEVDPFADEIGDVVMQKPSTLVRARLIDARDRPVVGVPVVITSEHGDRHGAVTDERGRFELKATLFGELELTLGDQAPLLRRWQLPQAVPVQAGPEEQVVHVETAPSLRVTTTRPDLLAWFTCRAFEPDAPMPQFGQPVDDHLFVALARNGEHHVQVRFGDRLLVDLPRLVVRPGETDYEMLQNIELPGDLHTTELIVRTPNGEPLDVGVYLHGVDGFVAPRPLPLPTGRGAVAWFDGQRLTVQHREHRLVVLEPTGETTEVTMRPKARLRLRLPQGIELPASAVVIEQHVLFGDVVTTRHAWRQQPLVLRPTCDGEVTLSIEVPGPTGVLQLHAQTVTVPPHAELTDVTLAIDADAAQLAREHSMGK